MATAIATSGYKTGKELVKEGYTKLPAGVTRLIRINTDWIKEGSKYGEKAFMVIESPGKNQKVRHYNDVAWTGKAYFRKRTNSYEVYGVQAYDRSITIATDGPVYGK
jgi:hypothetical protein